MKTNIRTFESFKEYDSLVETISEILDDTRRDSPLAIDYQEGMFIESSKEYFARYNQEYVDRHKNICHKAIEIRAYIKDPAAKDAHTTASLAAESDVKEIEEMISRIRSVENSMVVYRGFSTDMMRFVLVFPNK